MKIQENTVSRKYRILIIGIDINNDVNVRDEYQTSGR